MRRKNLRSENGQANRSDALSQIANCALPIERRKQLCQSLFDIRDDEPEFEAAIEALLRMSSSDDPLGEYATSVLHEINERRYLEARRRILDGIDKALPTDGEKEAHLLFALLTDKEAPWEKRSAAFFLLGDLNPPGAIQALIETLSGDEPDVVFEAVNALFSIKIKLGRPIAEATGPLVTALRRTGVPNLAEAALYGLVKLGDPDARKILIEVFEDPRQPSALRACAIRGLPHEFLMRALNNPEIEVRIAAIEEINTMLPGVSEALSQLLRDEELMPGQGTVTDTLRWKLGHSSESFDPL
jgi:HEAT repeat protein